MNTGYMLDTVAFNRILDSATDLTTLPFREGIFATHAQRDEISKTPDPFRRKRLLRVFEGVTPAQIPTASAVWDLSRWDQACWGTDDTTFQAMVAELTRLDKEAGRSIKNPNVVEGVRRDILIAETAIQRGYTLVTDDPRLTEVTRRFGGKVCSIEEFLTVGHAH